MTHAQELLQSIAKKCAATSGEASGVKTSGEEEFRRILWKIELKAFAEEKLDRLHELLSQFLHDIEKVTNVGRLEEPNTLASSQELEQTVSQVSNAAVTLTHLKAAPHFWKVI